MAKFTLTEDGEKQIVPIKGIALNFQRTFFDFGGKSKLALQWRASFEATDMEGEFELWLTDVEARQLIARLQNAIGDTSNERH